MEKTKKELEALKKEKMKQLRLKIETNKAMMKTD